MMALVFERLYYRPVYLQNQSRVVLTSPSRLLVAELKIYGMANFSNYRATQLGEADLGTSLVSNIREGNHSRLSWAEQDCILAPAPKQIPFPILLQAAFPAAHCPSVPHEPQAPLLFFFSLAIMGSSKAPAPAFQPKPYRDELDHDDAASSSSDVLLADIDAYPDEDLPAYTDTPTRPGKVAQHAPLRNP